MDKENKMSKQQENRMKREKAKSILIVEDEMIVAQDLKKMLEHLGYHVPDIVHNGKHALHKVDKHKPDLLLMDVVLDDKYDGIKAAEEIRRYHDIPVVYLTAYADNTTLERAKASEPYGYITKPYDEKDLKSTIEIALYKHRTEEKLEKSFEKLRRSLEATVSALAAAVEARDPYTAGHQRRVAQLAFTIAKELRLPSERLEGIRIAALIHDIGKIYVPAEILSKPGQLSDGEFMIVKSHCQVGYDILKNIEFPWPIAGIVFQHHERINGAGYPQGQKDEDILLESKILGVADVVEAMCSHRPYRPAPGLDKALEEIEKNRGKLYDSSIVDVCIRLFRIKHFEIQDE